MNPEKSKLFIIMNELYSKNNHLLSFDRIENNKFKEDNNELEIIGKEIFNSIKIKQINFFIDICAAPGEYSKLILKDFPNSTGIGVSLPVEKGGVKFEIDNKKYKIFYKDILEKDYILELPKKLDFGIASCVSYIKDNKNAYLLNLELIFKSSHLILNNLDRNGNMIINMTIKNLMVCYNFINLLNKLFTQIKLWKSKTIWSTKKTFYIYCYGFKNNYNNELQNMISMVKNKDDSIFKQFSGNNKEYSLISKKINNIFLIRTFSLLKLIGDI